MAPQWQLPSNFLVLARLVGDAILGLMRWYFGGRGFTNFGMVRVLTGEDGLEVWVIRVWVTGSGCLEVWLGVEVVCLARVDMRGL